MQVWKFSQHLPRTKAKFQVAKLEEQLQVSFASPLASFLSSQKSFPEISNIISWDSIYKPLLLEPMSALQLQLVQPTG